MTTTKKLMMSAAGVGGGWDGVIAPSSNDFDYTFSQNEWPVAGNPLGDHTIGSSVDSTGGQSGITSLHTFSGDFTIDFTLTAGVTSGEACFGAYAIDEDDTRSQVGTLGMVNMTNSFFFYDAIGSANMRIGGSADGSGITLVDGSVMKFERIGGTMKLYDDDVLAHTFASTYSGTMRFIFCNDAGAGADYDNILYTVPTTNVQADGFFNEGVGASRASSGSSYDYTGQQWIATQTGTITAIKAKTAGGTGGPCHWEIWSSDGTSPIAQIDSDSDTLTFASGVDTQTFTLDVPVVKGTKYWAVHSSPTGNYDLNRITHSPSEMLCGRASTTAGPASITDDGQLDLGIEITIKPAGEPTPDHDTLLLVHSDTTDGSTTFVDSSQFGRTPTVTGDTQHDTAQKKFGTTSIRLDGAGDVLEFPDSTDFEFTGDFTLDFWFRLNATGADQGLINKSGSSWDLPWGMYVSSANKLTFQVSNNGGSGLTLTGSTTLTTGTWYHAAGVRVGNRFNLHLNGIIEATSTASYTIKNNSQTVKIGNREGTTNHINGWIDEVRISRVARWDANFTPPTSAYP